MNSVSHPGLQDDTQALERLRLCAAQLEALETLPKPYDLYYAVKNGGYYSGWTYRCANVGVTDIRAAVMLIDSAHTRIAELEAAPVIRLTRAEVQSGLDRQRWAEGLILQLPAEHDGRNSWLLNYGTSETAQRLRAKNGLTINPESNAVNPPIGSASVTTLR